MNRAERKARRLRRQQRREERLRRHKQRLYGSIALGLIAGVAVFLGLLWPITDGDVGTPALSPLGLVGAFFVVLAALLLLAIPVLMLGESRRLARSWLRYALAALLLPAAGVVWWAVDLREDHVVQDEAMRVWDAYTAGFSTTLEGEPFVRERGNPWAEVCDHRGSSDSSPVFCIAIDTEGPAGKQVAGGYQYTPPINEITGEPDSRTDCFGIFRKEARLFDCRGVGGLFKGDDYTSGA